MCDADNALKTLILADQYLRGSSCSIIDIWGLLKNLPKLETLNLNGHGIKTIPSGSFESLTSLKNLHLKHNCFAIIQFDLPPSFALHKLDLSHNTVLYISAAFCDKLNEIADRKELTVYLNNNTFLCDCERIEFMGWLKGSSAIYQRENLPVMTIQKRK